VVQEIQMSLQTSILSNTNNKMSQRMARNSQRQSTAARKVCETLDATDTSKQLQLQIDAEVEKHRAKSQLTKDLPTNATLTAEPSSRL
jgi:SET domain-containing protein